MIGPGKPGDQQRYVAQIKAMAKNGQTWRVANPDKTVLVQFNFPREILLVAPISTAIKNRLVTVNEAGLELVKALWPWDTKDEPSVLMVRVALEFSNPASSL
jgi:hypothetical protein